MGNDGCIEIISKIIDIHIANAGIFKLGGSVLGLLISKNGKKYV